jgi:hypothetical protein
VTPNWTVSASGSVNGAAGFGWVTLGAFILQVMERRNLLFQTNLLQYQGNRATRVQRLLHRCRRSRRSGENTVMFQLVLVE